MKRKRAVDDGIARGLEDGWDYKPDWRTRLVKRMRAQHREFFDVMASEKDPFVRQLFRLKTNGECAANEAFRWAEQCHATRKTSSACGIIKAMTIASCPGVEIAQRLHTSKFAVAVYQKLFFDIARYRGNRAWLAGVALSADPAAIPNPITSKARLLMAAAFHGGAERLKQVMFGSVPKDADVTRMHKEIRAVLTEKAHQFLLSGGTPSVADLERYLDVARLAGSAESDGKPDPREVLDRLHRLFHPEEAAAQDALAGYDALSPSDRQDFSNC